VATVGQRIRELREAKELTQGDLASRLAVVTSTVSQWETDKRMPDSLMLWRIADLFAVSVDYLLGRSNVPQPVGGITCDLPLGLTRLPSEMKKFIHEESKGDWSYLRLAQSLKMQDLSPSELLAIVETWMNAKKRYEREFGK